MFHHLRKHTAHQPLPRPTWETLTRPYVPTPTAPPTAQSKTGLRVLIVWCLLGLVALGGLHQLELNHFSRTLILMGLVGVFYGGLWSWTSTYNRNLPKGKR